MAGAILENAIATVMDKAGPADRAPISQLMQLKPALPWVCRLLGIEPPDGGAA